MSRVGYVATVFISAFLKSAVKCCILGLYMNVTMKVTSAKAIFRNREDGVEPDSLF